MSAAGRGARTARVEAQAKLNLFLRILSREPGGYHQLETLFQRVALADAVAVTTGVSGRSLDSRGASTGPVEKNLAWRAASAYVDATGGPPGFRIEIEKRIPVAGGLGGGSADAAAVLRALNALSEKPLDDGALAALAFALGADVPYLLATHATAYGSGRGERLFPLEPLPVREVLLAVPPFGVSSADAFGWFAARKDERRSGTRATLAVRRRLEWNAIAALAVNDLEGVVAARHPEIGALRAALEAAGGAPAMMTGSGSTVFGIFSGAIGDATLAAVECQGARAIRTATVERAAEVHVSD